MIPLKLELKNFLAYRDPAPLDLTGIHLAALIGPNGAGKTSLLDAMTWAIWGKARGKRDEDLIHQGQSEMRVTLTFELSRQVYRIMRVKKVGRGANTSLNFHIRDEAGKWKMLDEPTARKTQDKIVDVLRLTYETFINSAYLAQGKADAFTSKTPAERKQVLADILGLKSWEVYEDRAKERLKRLAERDAVVSVMRAEAEAELARRETYQQALIAAQHRAEDCRERYRLAELAWREVSEAQTIVAGLNAQVNQAEQRARELHSDMQQAQAEADRARALADADHWRAESARAQAELAALEATEQQRQDLLQTLADQQAAQAALSAQLTAIEAEGRQLKAQKELAESETRAAEDRARAQRVDSQHKLNRRVDELKSQHERYRQARQQAAQAETRRLETRAVTLRAATDPQCPTCGQPLSPEKLADLLTQLEQEAAAVQARLMAELHAEQAEHQARLDALIQDEEAFQRQQSDLLAADRATRQQRAAELEAEIQSKRQAFAQTQADLKTLTASAEATRRAITALEATLSARPRWQARLAEAQAALAQADEARARWQIVQARLERWQAALALAQQQIADLNRQKQAYAAVLQTSAERKADLMRLETEVARARAAVGSAEQQLNALDNVQARLDQYKAEQRALSDEKKVYEALKLACGKNGVPAMMIDAAVPEIEAAANRLLGQMTAGRLQVRLSTQRETQAGDVRETLDLHISDELGTRPYEMYSGGEAFRVNFAVRLALSQLLAHRAGTQLQTLIVDEGFGALDDAGRDQMVQALHAVRDNFRCVLVVTHIEELKDAFQTRIEVIKTPHGSEITLV